MATSEPIAFPTLAELFERVGPNLIEQAIARDNGLGLGRDQRFRGEIGKAVSDFGRRELGAREGQSQLFLTLGVISGPLPITKWSTPVVGIGCQFALSPRGPAYNNVILTVRLPF